MLGFGKRVTGMAADVISAEIQQRTAEQLFSVLGQLKGGAMKFGQALSVFEAALPEEIAGPYRQALTKLQEAAPPLPAATVHKVLRRAAGRRLAEAVPSSSTTARPPRRSIGQVHRAVWKCRDGRAGAVAVKMQYPGAGDALIADLKQLSRLAGMFKVIQPGLDIKPLLAELRDRITEELDYELEADVAAGVRRPRTPTTPRSSCRGCVASAPRVLVTEWVDGHAAVEDHRVRHAWRSATGPGALMATLHFSAPARAGLLHADPHPGNFRMLPDGRLGVIDFGAVARLPGGHPEPIGRLTRLALAGRRRRRWSTGCARRASSSATTRSTPQAVLDFLRPMLEPIAVDEFQLHPGLAARRGGPARQPAQSRPTSSAASSTCRRRTC